MGEREEDTRGIKGRSYYLLLLLDEKEKERESS